MLYIRIDKDGALHYPFDTRQLSVIFPGTLWRAEPTPAQLDGFGVYIVQPTPQPQATRLQQVVERTPEKINGVWTQTWAVVDRSPEDIASITASLQDNKYKQVHRALRDTDWTQLPDTPPNVRAAYALYRTQLRALLDEKNPDLVVLPALPNVTSPEIERRMRRA